MVTSGCFKLKDAFSSQSYAFWLAVLEQQRNNPRGDMFRKYVACFTYWSNGFELMFSLIFDQISVMARISAPPGMLWVPSAELSLRRSGELSRNCTYRLFHTFLGCRHQRMFLQMHLWMGTVVYFNAWTALPVPCSHILRRCRAWRVLL